jgi:hypothetical protein
MQHPITATLPKPGTPVPHSGHNATLLTGVIALLAVVALGVASPKFSGHAHAKSAATAAAVALGATMPTAAPTTDPSVPSADEVFKGPQPRGAMISPEAPTF